MELLDKKFEKYIVETATLKGKVEFKHKPDWFTDQNWNSPSKSTSATEPNKHQTKMGPMKPVLNVFENLRENDFITFSLLF